MDKLGFDHASAAEAPNAVSCYIDYVDASCLHNDAKTLTTSAPCGGREN